MTAGTSQLTSPPTSPLVSPLVTIRDLHVGYVRRRRTAPAVRGVDLSIGSGEIVALVGESGSGKSTIANTIIGLLPDNARVTAGSVLLHTGPDPEDADGPALDDRLDLDERGRRPVEIVGAREKVLRELRGRVVGLVPQDPMVGLNPTRRIGGQVAEAIRLRGVTGDDLDAEVLEFLAQAGVDNPQLRARQYPHELSGGLRQRVLIGIALAGRPRLIIADEPTSALDVTVQRRILDHLEGLVRESGISLLIITHDLAVAADRGDRVVVLQDGEIVEQGPPGDILVSPAQDYTRRLIAAAPGLAHGGQIVPRFQLPPEQVATPDPVIRLENVSKRYPLPGRQAGSFLALDGVSVEVARGRTHALVGESGSGKTTMLRIAFGFEQATDGRVSLDGVDITGLGWKQTRLLRRKVQLVHQNPYASLDPRFTVGQSITEPLVSFRIGDRRTRTARALELLDQVALPGSYLDRLPAELSGGQRQRVAIARALALSPELVLLDEPVSALDVSVQEQILELLTDLQERLGLSYLFVSHDLAVVARISHTVSVLNRGRQVESGSVAAVFGSPSSEYTRELIDAVPGQRGATRQAGSRDDDVREVART
ncbi:MULTISPECIES: ABC transporter ATP-binding protein [unclassified Parafrankia]|uniref:ATP-binding cassette domain-containing protein n=1 Tax=unclassified Parafrankia TaxID=2994368 RepID=UPI000DA59C9B|nr:MULTISPECIES: ABC transporter ATP-binding protein [unclassified Parafrankia]TCJ33323.1 ABC transporter ATP-binding protein [Parafrankia sp. BMG5.11]SQD93502.1 putative peptide transport fused subunits of ABC superfamily: ATP-binding components [Parafrankia sp. Ea1.12]